MSQINPFTGSILQAPQVQRQQSAEKDRQVRRSQDLAKNSALPGDQFEHQVESSEELTPIQGDQKQQREFKRQQSKKDDEQRAADDKADGEEPHIDLTA